MTTEQVRQLIENGIPGAKVEVTDTRGTGDHFHVVVIAPQFEGQSLVNQHRQVYQACGEHLTKEIHALQLNTFSPEQWADEQGA